MDFHLLLLIVAIRSSHVTGDFVLEVQVHAYSNPTHVASTFATNAFGDCCDPQPNDRINDTFCVAVYDNILIFCFREAGGRDTNTNGDDDTNCPYGRSITEVIGLNNDNLIFTVGENFPDGVPNPVVAFGQAWPGSIQLAIQTLDHDFGMTGDDEVDIFFIDTNPIIGVNFFAPITYMGVNGYGQIQLSFRLNCTENYYGPACATFCMEKDDDQGHYTCGSDGSFVCREGYQDPSSFCRCIPAEDCVLPPSACLGQLAAINCDASGRSCDYTASFAVHQDDSITITMSARTAANTWVGIGVSDDQLMPNTDVVLGAADGGNSFVNDRFAVARAPPPIDASQDLTAASASHVDGVTTVTFNRPRNSGDSSDISLDVCRFFLFAFGGPVNFATQVTAYHSNNRSISPERICIPLFTECSEGENETSSVPESTSVPGDGDGQDTVSSGVAVGAIVGGVMGGAIGGLLVLAVIILTVIIKRRKCSSYGAAADRNEEPELIEMSQNAAYMCAITTHPNDAYGQGLLVNSHPRIHSTVEMDGVDDEGYEFVP